MMNLRGRLVITGLVIAAASLLFTSAKYYRAQYLQEKKHNQLLGAELVEVKHTLEALHLRNKALAEADARYIRELDNAKTTIEELELNVATGRQRLQLAATCPRVPPAAPASGVDDGATPRLTHAAEQDYFALRSIFVLNA